VSAGSFTGVGRVEKANVGFLGGNGKYMTISFGGPLEVTSCVGNVSMKQGVPFIHAHISLADKQGKGYGGHLMQGCIVDATFEVVLHVYGQIDLQRKLHASTKLYLLET
jgi:hypothetical protein